MQIFVNKKKYGFTLIELLVVIAIIGILASIVLVSVSGARDKARDARIVSDIAQIRTQETIFLNANNVYAGECTTTEMIALCDDIAVQNAKGQPTFAISASAQEYCVYAALRTKYQGTDDFFCADSTGKAGYTGLASTTCVAAVPVCGTIR